MRKLSIFTVSAIITLCTASVYAADVHEKDHAELTELRQTTEKAINDQQFETLRPLLAKDDLTVVTVDGKKLTGLDQFSEYWKNLFTDKTTALEKVTVHPVADGPTEFLSDTVGICHGQSTDEYTFKGGEVRTMPERWTAVVVKEGDKWKISRIIFSASVLDNPIVKAIEQETQKFIAAAGIGGFIMGALAGFLFGSKKKAA